MVNFCCKIKAKATRSPSIDLNRTTAIAHSQYQKPNTKLKSQKK